jgi:hypothetical protein
MVGTPTAAVSGQSPGSNSQMGVDSANTRAKNLSGGPGDGAFGHLHRSS